MSEKQHRVKIIAECCQNHGGNIAIARVMIRAAGKAKADFVKFQLLKADLLLGPLLDEVKKAELSLEQMRELKACADDHGLGFICTPFYPEAVGEIASLDPAFIKIRERDSTNDELIESALKTGKKMLISAVEKPQDMRFRYHPAIKWLWCIPKYPPEPEDMNFASAIAFDGLSDHFPDTDAAFAFVTLMLEHKREQVFIEKHVTLDKSRDDIDQAVSIDFVQLEEFVMKCRKLEKMRFDGISLL